MSFSVHPFICVIKGLNSQQEDSFLSFAFIFNYPTLNMTAGLFHFYTVLSCHISGVTVCYFDQAQWEALFKFK